MAALSDSLCQLPDLVWKETCQSLDEADITQLYNTRLEVVQSGCLWFLRETTATFVLEEHTENGKPCSRLTSEDKKWIRNFGFSLSRLRLLCCGSDVEEESLFLIARYTQSLRRVQVVFLKFSTVDNCGYLYDAEAKWASLGQKAQEGGTEIVIDANIRFYPTSPSGELYSDLSGPQCQLLTGLQIVAALYLWLSLIPRLFYTSPRLFYTSVTSFVAKFPNLRELSLQLHTISDELLIQLAQLTTALTEVSIFFYRASLKAPRVSADAWTRLFTSLPLLRVNFEPAFFEDEKELETFDEVFHSDLEARTPLYAIAGFRVVWTSCHGDAIDLLIDWIEQFASTLRYLSLVVGVNHSESFPGRLLAKLKSFCRAATHVMYVKPEVSAGEGTTWFKTESWKTSVDKVTAPQRFFN